MAKNSDPKASERQEEEEAGVVTTLQVERPALYRVLLHNDDYTTMEFVVHILKKHFSKDEGAAQRIMLQVHQEGVGLCGVYTHEVAESKVAKVLNESEQNGYPLICSCEPD